MDNLIQKYHTIFPIDIDLRLREEGLDAMALQGANGSPITAPIRKKSMAFDRQSREEIGEATFWNKMFNVENL